MSQGAKYDPADGFGATGMEAAHAFKELCR